MVKLVPGEVYCCDCHHKVMAETKKKQKCNINIINVTKNSDEDKKVNRYFLTFTSLGQSIITNVIGFKPTDNLIDGSTDQAA